MSLSIAFKKLREDFSSLESILNQRIDNLAQEIDDRIAIEKERNLSQMIDISDPNLYETKVGSSKLEIGSFVTIDGNYSPDQKRPISISGCINVSFNPIVSSEHIKVNLGDFLKGYRLTHIGDGFMIEDLTRGNARKLNFLEWNTADSAFCIDFIRSISPHPARILFRGDFIIAD